MNLLGFFCYADVFLSKEAKVASELPDIINSYVYTATTSIFPPDDILDVLSTFPKDDVVFLLYNIYLEESDVNLESKVIKSRAFNTILALPGVDQVQFILNEFDRMTLNWQFSMVQELAMYEDKRAITKLCSILRWHVEPSLRTEAAFGLGKIGDYSAIPALEHAVQHDHEVDWDEYTVAEVAQKALIGIRQRLVDDMPE